MHRRDVVVRQAEPLGRPGPEVLGHDVEARREAQDQVPARRLLEVDHDRALGEVVAHERRADAAALGVDHGGHGAAAEIAGARRLHLDDVGAQPAEQLGGVGERLHLLEGEDPHAVERLAPVRRLRVDDVAQLHAMSRPSISMALPRMMA